jgi:hypothetical protein
MNLIQNLQFLRGKILSEVKHQDGLCIDEYKHELDLSVRVSPSAADFIFGHQMMVLEFSRTHNNKRVWTIDATITFLGPPPNIEDEEYYEVLLILTDKMISEVIKNKAQIIKMNNLYDKTPKANFKLNDSVGALSMGRNAPGVMDLLPEQTRNAKMSCPECVKKATPDYHPGLIYEIHPLMEVIIHLNDIHHWERERTAEWLDDLHAKGILDLTIEIKDPDIKSNDVL